MHSHPDIPHFSLHSLPFQPDPCIPTLIPSIPIPILFIPTLIPLIPILIPSVSTLIIHISGIPTIPTLIPCIPTPIPCIPTFIPRVPTLIPCVWFPDSPFRLLEIAFFKKLCFFYCNQFQGFFINVKTRLFKLLKMFISRVCFF